ncbi:MAG TPA: hypothetical protein VLU46_03090 [Thermoanaerobaculia bacterium]|nr:hypothetical protein [Thermoanaerobaculia bacterium]
MSERAIVRFLVIVTIAASAVRLLSVFGLHPLNWDEIEFFRATNWVAQGLTPYRDFWEHHTPLQWYLFAPFAAMTKSAGAAAIVGMRIVQVPLWIATFWLANVWMRRAGLAAFGRWTAIALATCSSVLMIPAVEYRVDVVSSAVYIAAVVILSREDGEESGRWLFLAGAVLCLTAFANIRFGPLLAATALLYAFIDRTERKWRWSWRRAIPLGAGVVATLAVVLGYFALRGALAGMYQHVGYENYLGDKYGEVIPHAFIHRVLVPFGVRIYGAAQPSFEWSGIDLPGAAIVILGLVGLARGLMRWRRPDEWLFFALLQVANVVFIWKMKYVYNYHFEIVVLMFLPFVAREIERSRAVRPAIAFAGVSLLIALFLVIFRGKESDFAYQDLIMREADAHTAANASVFDGVGWALRRSPAYQFWFLPDLIRQLVGHGFAPPYRVNEWIARPPQAVITDRNCAVWLAMHPDLGSYVVRHYVPLWRNLWLPALNARLDAMHGAAQWVAPVDGDYRVIASPALAEHPWFAHPFAYRIAKPEIDATQPGAVADMIWYVNRQPAAVFRGRLRLKKGDVVNVISMLREPIGIFLLPGNEPLWFRQPPPGVTLDSEAARVTHVPDLRLLQW